MTSSVFAALTAVGVEVIDIEQIILRRRLILGVLVTAPRDWRRVVDAVQQTAAGLDMQVEIERGTGDNRARQAGRSHVTVIGSPLKAGHMAAVAGRIADTGGNIDRIERMARYPVTAIDLHVSGADPDHLRSLLAVEAASQGIDIAVQPATLLRRGVRLIVMDVDSTLIQGEVIEMLAAHAGHEDEVARVTEAAMRGELDFEASLRERVRLLAGLDASALDTVYDAIVVTPGARTMVRTLRRLGYRFAIVSGGFSQITDRLAADLGIHFARANELEIVDGRLTGEIVGDGRRPGRQGPGAARVRRRGRRTDRGDHRHRRRRQRPRHAQRGRSGRRLQRPPDRAGGRRHHGQRALPRHDPLPARHLPRGDRGRRRRGRHRHARPARLRRVGFPGAPGKPSLLGRCNA